MLRIMTRTTMLLGLGTCLTAFAQGNDSLNIDVAACVNLASEEARFACYEERANAARSSGNPAVAERPGPAAAPAPAAPAQPPRTTADNPTAPASARSAGGKYESERHEIYGTITALRETIPNQWIITLDNGQVWQMNQAKRYPLRIGLEVMLYDTNWGSSYRLTAPEHGGFVQVQRAN